MNQVELDSLEMKTFLNFIIKNNRFIQANNKKPVAVEIIGDSGLGKTSIALQVAKEHSLDLVKINLAQIEELGDLVGFPVRQFELTKTNQVAVAGDGFKMVPTKTQDGKIVMVKTPVTNTTPAGTNEALWLDENAVDQYLKNGYSLTGKKRMSYCPPEWIADKKGGGILLLDDWNRADTRFIQAIMELVDRQEYISWKLPEDWHIILTANPDNGDYLVQSIDTAQKTRFISSVLKWNADRWAEWAEKEKIDGRCINFVLMHPEIITARINPRSLTTFFNCISSLDDFAKHLPMVQMIGEGSVGPETSTLFTSFIHNKLDSLVTPAELLFDKDEKKVFDKLHGNLHENSNYRADIASILTTRVINYSLYYAENNPIDSDLTGRILNIIRSEDLFTNDLRFLMVKKIVNGSKQKFSKMLNDPIIQQMIIN